MSRTEMRLKSRAIRAPIFLGALLAAFLLFPAMNALGDDDLVLKLQTDKESYRAGDQMVITANLTRNNIPVVANISFQIDDPAGTPVLIFTKPTYDNGTATIIIKMDYDARTGIYQVYGSARVENIMLSTNHALTVKPTKTASSPAPAFPYLPLAIILLIAVAIGGGIAYYGRKRSHSGAVEKTDDEKAEYEARGRELEKTAPAEDTKWDDDTGNVKEAVPVAATAVIPEAKPDQTVPVATTQFLVEEVFLVYRDGRLIAHETRRMSPKDADVMTGMFTAVQQFVKESFSEEGELGSLEYGDNEVLLERGQKIFLAVVVQGTTPKDFRETLRTVVRNVETQYSSIIESWDGTINLFTGVKKMLLPIFDAASEGEISFPKSDVEMHSGVEFFQGYIRVKVAIKNASRSVITGVEFEPIYDEQVFHLVRLEPSYPVRNGRIDFGVVNPGIKKTAALYLEPMICTECYIEGTLRYKDAEGTLHSEVLKRKKVEVVCPIFYTDENINTAMLRRLVNEELTQQDSRIYYVDNLERSYAVAKEMVRGHQVRLVRELADEQGASRESWFYGLTQDRKSKIIIKVSAHHKSKMLEIFVATPGKLMLTGCLAEIGRDISGRLEKEGLANRQLVDMAKKEQVLRETLTLIEKFAEAEADAGETEL